MRSAALLSICLSLIACQAAPPAAGTGAKRVSGLEASLPSVQWSPGVGTAIEAVYALEWVEAAKLHLDSSLTWSGKNLWVLELEEPARFQFWDANGSLTGEATHHFEVQPGFRDRAIKRNETSLTVAVPANSSSVSVAFGMSGLDTYPIKLPSR